MPHVSASDSVDLAGITGQQEVIRALGITVGQFQKTVQGTKLILDERPFCLGGKLYQGYMQKPIETDETQLADKELDSIVDVDGTLAMVLAKRRGRLEGNLLAKNQELGERRKKTIAAERDALELELLKRQMAKEIAAEPVPPPVEYECDVCGKKMPTAGKLNMHKVGAHREKRGSTATVAQE